MSTIEQPIPQESRAEAARRRHDPLGWPAPEITGALDEADQKIVRELAEQYDLDNLAKSILGK